MIWTGSLMTLVLVAPASRLGHSGAVATIDPICSGGICESHVLHDLLGDVAADLLPRLGQTQDHDFHDLTTHWSRQEHQLFPRLCIPKEPEPVVPREPRPNEAANPSSSYTDPDEDAEAGLDPTKPDNTPSTPTDDPEAGLDPTKPDEDPSPTPTPTATPSKGPAPSSTHSEDPDLPTPDADSDPSPTAVSDSTNSGLDPAFDDKDSAATARPSTAVSAAGGDLKRSTSLAQGSLTTLATMSLVELLMRLLTY